MSNDVKKQKSKVFGRFKIIISAVSFFYALFPKKVLKKLLVFHRNTSGNIGYGIRYCIIKNLAISCGENVSIGVGVFFFHPERMSFGNNVSINPMTYLSGIGGLTIGNDVSIAHRVTIMTATHRYEDKCIPIRDQGLIIKPVSIEDNVWIGAGVTVVAGNIIGSGSIIGANSLVTKNIPQNEIWGGVPAKYLKSR